MIGDELAEGEEREDPRRPGVTKKGEPAALHGEAPDQAAQLMAVGAVIVRRPAMMPIRSASAYM